MVHHHPYHTHEHEDYHHHDLDHHTHDDYHYQPEDYHIVRDTIQSHDGEDHPVFVSGTGQDSFIAHDGDEYIVADHVGHGYGDEIMHELGELGSWFGTHHVFLDGENTTDSDSFYLQ